MENWPGRACCFHFHNGEDEEHHAPRRRSWKTVHHVERFDETTSVRAHVRIPARLLIAAPCGFNHCDDRAPFYPSRQADSVRPDRISARRPGTILFASISAKVLIRCGTNIRATSATDAIPATIRPSRLPVHRLARATSVNDSGLSASVRHALPLPSFSSRRAKLESTKSARQAIPCQVPPRHRDLPAPRTAGHNYATSTAMSYRVRFASSRLPLPPSARFIATNVLSASRCDEHSHKHSPEASSARRAYPITADSFRCDKRSRRRVNFLARSSRRPTSVLRDKRTRVDSSRCDYQGRAIRFLCDHRRRTGPTQCDERSLGGISR